VGSGLVDLYIKGTLSGELFAISRNWLNPGKVSLSGIKAPNARTSRIQKIRKFSTAEEVNLPN